MRASFILPVIFSIFNLGAQGLYWVGSYQPAKEDRFLQMRFARYDVSGDNSLNMREFASSRGNARFKEISRANLLAFLIADVTGDMLLNEREYFALHCLSKVLLPGERALIFGKADKNRDGQLSAEEWPHFLKRTGDSTLLAYYDSDQNGFITWTEWLGYGFTANKFAGARMKDLKRVLPESLVTWVERETSVYDDLILGARDNPWTREVMQQLALFAPVRSRENGIDYLAPVGSGTLTLSGNYTYTGSTYVQTGSLSVAGNSVTTSSNAQTIQLPTITIVSPLEKSSEGWGSSLPLESSGEGSSQTTHINTPTNSSIDVSVTVTVFRSDNSPMAKFPIGISDVFPLTPPDSSEIAE